MTGSQYRVLRLCRFQQIMVTHLTGKIAVCQLLRLSPKLTAGAAANGYVSISASVSV